MLAISNKTLKIVAAAATVSEKTKAAKNLQNQKKTSSKYRANESRAELVPAMPSAAKLGALVHKFPYRDAFSVNISGVL